MLLSRKLNVVLTEQQVGSGILGELVWSGKVRDDPVEHPCRLPMFPVNDS